MKKATGKEINILDRSSSSSVFTLCKASQLSDEDKFMRHIPVSHEEAMLRMLLEGIIREGINDFFAPLCEPSISEEGTICYVKDGRPAIGKSYDWWEGQAIHLCPERKTRIGTEKEYIAFLGCQIKKLSKIEMSVEEAWKYATSDAIGIIALRKFFGMYATLTHKLLAEAGNSGGYWISGDGKDFPLSLIHYYKTSNVSHNNALGWIICEE